MAAQVMSPDGRRRSREHWTDTMEAGPADPPAHVHRLPGMVRAALVGLVVAVLLLAIALGMMAVQVYRAQQYVNGKGEQRDLENARTNERINHAICDLLDQLPEGGLLDRPRVKYGCGPGLPVSSLTPEEQQQLSTSRWSVRIEPLTPESTPAPERPTCSIPGCN